MVTTQETSVGFSPDGRSLVIGAVLIGAGSAIGLAGLAICSASVVSATRRWIGDMEVPPRQLARQNSIRAGADGVFGFSRNLVVGGDLGGRHPADLVLSNSHRA